MSSSDAGSARPAFPWRQSALPVSFALAAFLLLPILAPGTLTGLSKELILGLVSGLVVGVALRVDSRITPLIAVASFAGVVSRFLLDGDDPRTVILLGLVIAIEVWVLTYLIRLLGADRLERPQDVLLLVIVAASVGIIAGLVAGVGLGILDPEFDLFSHALRSWAVDDVFGILCIAPAVVTLHRPVTWVWRQVAEFVIVVSITIALAVFIFRVVDAANPGLLGWAYLVLIGPLWIAVRLGVQAVTPVTAVLTWFAVSSTTSGAGVFALASTSAVDRLVAVQLFSIVLAVTLLMLAILRDSRLRSMRQLSESSRLLDEVVNGADSLVFAKAYDDSGTGRYVLVNHAWEYQLGLGEGESLGQSDAEVFPEAMARVFQDNDHSVIEANAPITVEEQAKTRSGETRSFSTSKFPLRRADGSVWGVGGIATDTSELLHALDRERRQGELLRTVFDLSPTPAIRILLRQDLTMDTLAVNAAMCSLLRAPDHDETDCALLEHVHADDTAAVLDVLRSTQGGRARRDGSPTRHREARMLDSTGRVIWVLVSAAAVGAPTKDGAVELVVQFEDFTARRHAEEALTEQALRDAVTGLPNRRALNERLGAALQRLRRHPGMVAVLFCDLDHFKDVNDTQGHEAGDRLLVEVAARMQAALRPEDTVARLGGDEFVAMGEGIADADAAVQLATRLLNRINAPWVQGQTSYRPSVSIGVAMTEDPDVTTEELLRRADLAMYRAKERGRGRVEIYEKSVDDRYRYAVALQHDLRRAIDVGGLVLHYQPIVTLADRQVIGAEALIRMVGRDGELLAPGSFVPAAETSGLVVPMGAWVVRQAIAQVRAWCDAGTPRSISVNVSPSQLRDEGFARFVLAQADAAGVDPAHLAVEVTETVLVNEPGRSARELGALSEAGVGICLDDFGTGYSSLSWLTQFPVNVVKIDRSFTDELGVDERKTAIVNALIQVSHELGFSVVAEGVETPEQAAKLIGLGCDNGQGFLFGRPVPADTAPWV